MLYNGITARHRSLVGPARVQHAKNAFAVTEAVVQVHFRGGCPLVGVVGAWQEATEGQYRGGVFAAIRFGDGPQLRRCL